jgi:energy-converting hydrogenase Eha subunit F
MSMRDCYEMCYRFDTETGRIPTARLTPIAELIPENRNFCQRTISLSRLSGVRSNHLSYRPFVES